MYDKISTHHQTVFLSIILNNDQAVCHWHLCAKEPFGLRFTICYLVEQGGEGTMVYALSFGNCCICLLLSLGCDSEQLLIH